MATGGGESEVLIWVKPEAFQFGILPIISPHHKLTPKYLKYIIPYAQTKGSLGYPKLSYTVWKHIACNKLVVPEDLAWVLFLTYRTLQRGRSESRVQWDDHYAKKTQDREYLKSLTSVDTLKFTLLLYLQNYNKINLRSSSLLSISTEEWPNLDKTLSGMKSSYIRNASRRALKIFDEDHQVRFVEKKLVEIIELLQHKDQSDGDGRKHISLEVIETLSLIIEGSMDNCRSVVPLHNILLSNYLRSKLGYSNTRQEFVTDLVIDWILDNLKAYPYSLSKGLSFEPKMLNGIQNEGEGKIIASEYPSHKRLILTRLTKQTIVKSSDSLRGVKLHIHRCSHCYIYILVPIRSVVITKCHDTTIVLGPVSNSVNVIVGKSLRLISACRRIVISNCSSSNFFLLTPSQPVLTGNRNEGIVLAPYNTTYPKLEEHLNISGIGTSLNLWDSPVCIAEEGNFEFQQFSKQPWEFLPTDEFYIFNIPFDMEGNTKSLLGNMSERYEVARRQQLQVVDEWHCIVEDANLCQKKRNQLNKLLRDRFNRWLTLKGHQRELDSLSTCQIGNDVKPAFF